MYLFYKISMDSVLLKNEWRNNKQKTVKTREFLSRESIWFSKIGTQKILSLTTNLNNLGNLEYKKVIL